MRDYSLSLLCVSKGESCVLPLVSRLKTRAAEMGAEWVLVADGREAYRILDAACFEPAGVVQSEGYLESVYEDALGFCRGTDILRLDDDESIGPDFVHWIKSKDYQSALNWRFTRKHLWKSEREYLTNSPLFPDYQTRLSVSSLAGNRTTIHAPSVYGKGHVAPVPIVHHKFIVRSREERERQADHYESIRAGAGRGKFLPFLLPEVAFKELTVQSIGS